MFEADELCNRLAVITAGRIVAEGTPQELKSRVRAGNVLEVEIFDAAEEVLPRIEDVVGVDSVNVESRDQAEVLVVRSDGQRDVMTTVLQLLDGKRLGKVSAREPTLEDAYVELVTAE
jgi:ABC-2 type transport system ATP-binding protein